MTATLVTVLLVRGTTSNVLWSDVCTQPDTKATVWCDTTKPHATRAAAFVDALKLEEKFPLLTNEATGVKRLHIPPYQWGSEGLHGPLEPCVCGPSAANGGQPKCACPTSFPAPSAQGAAFNTTLYHLVGHFDGLEARAINNCRNHATQNNYGDGIDYWSPTINMQRDPRWGRNQEVPGEDPMLTGQYAANFVQGLQGLEGEGGPVDPDGHTMILACCKHFVANSLEGWEGHTRHNFDAKIPLDEMADYYLPAFKACVQEGRSKGVMCSYNSVNGIPMCANELYLNSTLRHSWRFDGYVTSDCDAVGDISGSHHYATAVNGSALALKAGTDMDCGDWGAHAYLHELPAALSAGLIAEADLDLALRRLTKLQMDLGLFDPKDTQTFFQLGIDVVGRQAHKQLALEGARQSIVLLKNAGVLPLGHGRAVAVLGPHQGGTEVFLSNYHGSACLNATGGIDHNGFECILTPCQAIQSANGRLGGTTTCATGATVSANASDYSKAVANAKAADVVVMVMGIDGSIEREGHDRVTTDLPGPQQALLSAVLGLKKPVVLVLVHGGAMSIGDEVKAGAAAIVDAFYGGEMASQALADVLVGTYNPTGKLPMTMYPKEFAEQVPLTQMSVRQPPGRTHMYYTGKQEFSFGDGLSYTQFELTHEEEDHTPPPTSMSTAVGDSVQYTLRLTNVGARVGGATVLGFLRPRDAPPSPTTSTPSTGRVPLRQKLFAFDGEADLLPGTTRRLRLRLRADDLAASNARGERVVAAGAYDVWFKVGSGQVLRAQTLRVHGQDRIAESYAHLE